MRRSVLAATLVLILALPAAGERERPRRAVLFIGDGMGLTQVALGRLLAEHTHRPYAFDRLPVVGLAATRAADDLVTDSAAAATAIGSGYKTKNGFLGVDPEGRARRTILELARESGFATGLVTTTRLTHATPAAFIAHIPDRHAEVAIGAVYPAGVDVVLGGGTSRFLPGHLRAIGGAGWRLVHDREGLLALKGPERVFGVFARDHMRYEIDRAGREPSLREMTEKALEVLEAGSRPFLLVVEGGRIDHAAHIHDAPTLAREQLAFAEAIDAALSRVERKSDLLVVVTADHATGAVAIGKGCDLEAIASIATSVEALVAAHPGVDLAVSPEPLRNAIADTWGFKPTDDELALARRARSKHGPFASIAHHASRRLGVSFFELDLSPAGVNGHEAGFVPVYAAGVGAEGFAGTYENVRIAHELARVLGLPAPGERIRDWR